MNIEKEETIAGAVGTVGTAAGVYVEATFGITKFVKRKIGGY